MPSLPMDASELPPLKFSPIYQERIWGGTLMSETLGRTLPPHEGPIGESWELCDRPGTESVVSEGALAGISIREILERFQSAVTGRLGARYERFPLLIKLIDAGERLSLQVHPDEACCREIGGNAEPKTEAWYIIAARHGAKILAGLQGRATRLRLQEMMDSPEVESLLQVYPSIPGDAYFITSGTLHAIGAGNLILEIQQNSDTTYRVSDWGRVGADGKPRELHREKGMMSINFANRTTPRISGVAGHTGFNRKYDVVKMCPFFQISDLRLRSLWNDDTAPGDSFHLISAVNHVVEVGREDKIVTLQPGETALVPACFGTYHIRPVGDGEAAVLKTTL